MIIPSPITKKYPPETAVELENIFGTINDVGLKKITGTGGNIYHF
jgi:hypothetical protein